MISHWPARCCGGLFLFFFALLLPVGSFGQAPRTAEEAYKNIKALKGTPADQLLPAMQFISSSLGVRCDHCHVEKAFEKDDKKPKEVARQMIVMMLQINRDNFSGERRVTCYSCHRGALRPAAIPAIAGELSQQHTSALSPPSPGSPGAANDVLEGYVRALGGDEALGSVASRVERGRVSLAEGVEVPVEIHTRQPGMRAMVMHSPSGDLATVYDGHTGWNSAPNRPIREFSTSENEAARMEADLQFPLHLKQYFNEFVLVPEEMVSSDPAKVVQATKSGSRPVKLYFHPHSGLLVRLLRYTETPLGLLPTQIDYSDYRRQDGIQLPFRWTVAQPEGKYTIQLDSVELNVPIDDARFRKPSR